MVREMIGLTIGLFVEKSRADNWLVSVMTDNRLVSILNDRNIAVGQFIC